MYNNVYIAKGGSSSNGFNSFEIPAFDAGEHTASIKSEPIKESSGTTSFISSNLVIIIAVILGIIIVSKIIKAVMAAAKPKELEIIPEEEPQQKQVIQIKTPKESSNYSTPSNITKCIRLFLENTRTK